MEKREKEEIRNAVRERYGELARARADKSDEKTIDSCPMISGNISNERRHSSCCCKKDFSADTISEIIGYTKEEMGNVPEDADMGLGCGNPVVLF